MKEYIPLEWFEGFIVGQNLAWDDRKIPTVTKSEICFERLKETCPHKHSDMCGDWFGGECCMNNCHLLKEAHSDIKTVTRLEICREFAKKVKEKFKNDYTTAAVEIGVAINETLAEMEKEE